MHPLQPGQCGAYLLLCHRRVLSVTIVLQVGVSPVLLSSCACRSTAQIRDIRRNVAEALRAQRDRKFGVDDGGAYMAYSGMA